MSSVLASPFSLAGAPRRPRRRVFLVVCLLATGVYFLLPGGVQEIAYLAFPLAAVAAIVVGARRRLGPGERAPWYLLAAGQLAFGGGDLVSTVYELRSGVDPFPSFADVLYLAGYPLLVAGIFLLLRRLGSREGHFALIDVAVAATAFALVQWVFLIEPSLGGGSGSAFERALLVAYPSADVLLIAGLARFLVTPAWRTPSFRYLLGGGLLLLGADEVYGFTAGSYSPGSWVNAAFLLSYVLWGVAALDPSFAELTAARDAAGPRLTRARVSLLAAALAAAPVVLVVQAVRGQPLHPWLVGGFGGALAALALTRVVGLVRALDTLRAELAESNERLLALDRLKDDFLSSISHDLRTPLVSIAAAADVLGAADEADADLVALVDRNARRGLRMVDDLLLAALLQGGAPRLDLAELDLAAEVRACVEAFAPAAAAAGVRLRVAADPAPVCADRARLAQVLDNVVSNALKFTPRDGEVEVRVHAEPGRAVVVVADSGIGIAAADRPQLFDRFFRSGSALARSVPGTGLGLHLVKAIVDAHGGAVTVESEEGLGTRVRVELPQPGR